MEYNQPSEIVKDVNFGDNAKNRVIVGVEKLTKAVKSTLGAVSYTHLTLPTILLV